MMAMMTMTTATMVMTMMMIKMVGRRKMMVRLVSRHVMG
jgi:hypothetical protein